MRTANSPRQLLLAAYRAALERVDGRLAVRRHLENNPFSDCDVVAVGKAAVAMTHGALDVLGDRARRILVITRHEYAQPGLPSRARVLQSGHPLPDADSLLAGAALRDFLSAGHDVPLLALISGGTSSLVEVLPDGITLDQLAAANHWLLGSGLDIATMNRVRKHLSLIKQGRLASDLRGRKTRLLLISDVPDDDPVHIGSGLLVADPAAQVPLPNTLPVWLAALCAVAPSAPTPGHPMFATIETAVIATNADARRMAAQVGRDAGVAVHLHDEVLTGEVDTAVERIHRELRSSAGMHVWGGEVTLSLPTDPGRGGRCQHLALTAALGFEQGSDAVLLAAGTDGSDGPGEVAGALVDSDTVARGQREGGDAHIALKRADAGAFLEASTDLLETGPTGTNVMDLVLAWSS